MSLTGQLVSRGKAESAERICGLWMGSDSAKTSFSDFFSLSLFVANCGARLVSLLALVYRGSPVILNPLKAITDCLSRWCSISLSLVLLVSLFRCCCSLYVMASANSVSGSLFPLSPSCSAALLLLLSDARSMFSVSVTRVHPLKYMCTVKTNGAKR